MIYRKIDEHRNKRKREMTETDKHRDTDRE